jgi:extradiol dioxygenase family protein
MAAIPFHLAFPVHDIGATREFYGGLLGCSEGRAAATWVDFDFFGHQISAHLSPAETTRVPANTVDDDPVPVRHFGVVLPWDAWHELRDRLIAAQVAFTIGPRIRFQGEIGEQATLFLKDPSGNALEFKSFKDPARLFAH